MTNEFFLHPVSETHARRVPFPPTLPLAARDAYMASPPADVLAAAELVPFPSATPPVAPSPAPRDDAAPFPVPLEED